MNFATQRAALASSSDIMAVKPLWRIKQHLVKVNCTAGYERGELHRAAGDLSLVNVV